MHYRPPAPVADSSAGTVRMLPLDPAPMWTVPSGSGEHYHQTVTSSKRAAATSFRTGGTRCLVGERYRLPLELD
jgi:hypothetical protein